MDEETLKKKSVVICNRVEDLAHVTDATFGILGHETRPCILCGKECRVAPSTIALLERGEAIIVCTRELPNIVAKDQEVVLSLAPGAVEEVKQVAKAEQAAKDEKRRQATKDKRAN